MRIVCYPKHAAQWHTGCWVGCSASQQQWLPHVMVSAPHLRTLAGCRRGPVFLPLQVKNVLDPSKAGIKTHIAPRSNRESP